MKKFLLLATLGTSIVNYGWAQDIITFRDGRQTEAKILEVTQSEIKYKKFRNTDGPLYTIGQHEVANIKYEYGEVEDYSSKTTAKFETTKEEPAQPSAPKLIELAPDAENKEIIAISKNNNLVHTNPNKKKYLYDAYKWAFTEPSIVSNREAKIGFEHYKHYHYGSLYHDYYNLILINKTDAPIYIDLGNCFRVKNGSSHCYYDPSKVISTSSGSSNGVGVNLGAVAGAFGIGGAVGRLAGGVTIGRGSSSGTNTIYQNQRITVVAPKSRGYISKWDQQIAECEWIYEGEVFYTKLPDDYLRTKGITNEILNENNSPDKIDYYITYSTDTEFKTYSILKFTVYLSQVIGISRERDVSTYGVLLYWRL